MARLRNWLERLSLKKRLILMTFCVTLLTVLMVSSYMGIYATDVLSDQAQAARAQLAKFTTTSISDRFSEALRVANMVLSQTFVTDAMETIAQHKEYPVVDQIKDEREIGSFVKSLENSSNFVRVRLLLCGDSLYSNEQVNFFKMSEEEQARLSAMRARGEYYEIMDNVFPYIFKNERRVISVTYTKSSSASFLEVDGAVVIDIDSNEILALMANMLVTEGDAVTLYNSDGEIMLTTGDAELGAQPAPESPFNMWVADEREGFVCYNTRLSTGNWLLSYRVRVDAMYAQVDDLLRNMVTMLTIALLLALLMTVTSSRANSRRILRLSAAMDRVRNGDFDVRVDEGGPNEIRVIEHSFNFLLDELQQMINAKLENTRQMANLEMRLLQSQIKPHFLYNSLDLICWRLQLMGDDKGARYVQALAQFYKVGLSRGSELIPLSDELRHVQLYVEIQNFRLDGSIELQIVLPQNCRAQLVPGNILQPLVENAIGAGIMEKPEHRGHISISCTNGEHALEILISDDGIGTDIDALRALLHQRSDSHYGVWNVNKRLQLLFGAQAGLYYDLNAAGGVDVRIIIPHTC